MLAQRNHAGVATAVVALMVLGTFAGVAMAFPHAVAPHTPVGAGANHRSSSSLSSTSAAAVSISTASTSSAVPTGGPSLLSAPAAPAIANSTPAPSTDRMAGTLGALRADGVPLRDAFLPNLNANPHPSLSSSGTVNLGYTTGPAPIGVAEYGIVNDSGTLVPENLSTTELVGWFNGSNELCTLVGNCTTSVLAADTGSPDAYGLQMNAVLQNVTLFGTSGYEFWTQNVIEYSTYSQQLYVITNIWNFSSPAMNFPDNIFVDHGANGTLVPGEFYYSVSGPYNISANYTAGLGLISTVVGGEDEVEFEFVAYNNTLFYASENDFAEFNSTGASGPAVTQPAAYVASGSVYTPLGIPSDWEFVMGGPGGGSNVDLMQMYAQMDLFYYNATVGNLVAVPSAYDVGSETGETATGASALWEGDWGTVPLLGTTGPGVWLTPGPTEVSGLWNVTNSTQGYGILIHLLSPSNGFTFLAPQDVNPVAWETFGWAPPEWVYFLPPANYSIWSLASNYDPVLNVSAGLYNGTLNVTIVTMTPDDFNGVYTPLWAFNQSGLGNITWNGYILFNDAFGQIGYDPETGFTFPWFGEVNDYTFPVFPGILLWGVFAGYVISPPSFEVTAPSWQQGFLDYVGLPTTNSLQMLFYDSESCELMDASLITGWWFTKAYFGPATPQYNVVFWNTSYSSIESNTFATASNALYLYGGTGNLIMNNTFAQLIPSAPDPYALSGNYFGTYGLFEADYGDAAFGGVICDCYDLIFNNVFDTYFTAISPLLDPYTGTYPLLPFSAAWNISYLPGETNIIGGDYLGGNYWWNYGDSYNPYGYLPYENFNIYLLLLWNLEPYGIYFGGDYLPLTPTPLFTVTFVVSGLPSGIYWSPAVMASDGYYVYNFTDTNTSNESWVAGVYNLSGYVESSWYTYEGNTTLVVTGNEVVYITFVPLLVVSFLESGLPAGAFWEVYLESYLLFESNGSNTTWVNFTVPGAGYDFYAFAYDDYGSVNASDFVDVVVNNSVVAVYFVPFYTVTIQETGLPASANWTITIAWNMSGSNYSISDSTSGSPLVLGSAPTNNYSWWVSSPGYVASPASGVLDLTSNTTIDIVFAAAESVTFTESGLASGTAWTVGFTQGSNTTVQTTTATSMTFAGIAGAYNYTVGASGYVPGSGTGSGTLPAGGPVLVSFSPAPATIVFDESGLPAGTHWTVDLTQYNSTTDNSATTASQSIGALDGAYSYTVSASGFVATPSSGSGVLPSDTPVEISFAPAPATIDFEESGLAAGALWTVAFTQNSVTTTYAGATGTISIGALDGAYSYTVAAAGYVPTPGSGSGSLPTGTPVSISFAPAPATIVFDESGLAAGTNWSVSFTQDATTTPYYSTTASITVHAVDGAYSYTVSTTGYTAAPSSGSGSLPGDTPVDIAFALIPEEVQFTETGLPAGTAWTVHFTQYAALTNVTGTGTITIDALYGAFSYVITAANYTATPSSDTGALPANATVAITFAVHKGTLAGTVTPSSATLTVGGSPVTLGGTGSYSDLLAPGVYAVAVTASGYYSYYTNVTVVSGKTVYLNVSLQSVPSTSTSTLGVSGSNGWALVAGLAVLALVLLGTTLVFWRRSRRAPPMTQYSGSSAPPAAAGGGAGTPAWSEGGPGAPPPGTH